MFKLNPSTIGETNARSCVQCDEETTFHPTYDPTCENRLRNQFEQAQRQSSVPLSIQQCKDQEDEIAELNETVEQALKISEAKGRKEAMLLPALTTV